MKTSNIVFIAKSLDGYIAGPNGELDWLETIPNPDHLDMGFMPLIERIDALVMGRTTFETVCSFGGPWPYSKPVFVLRTTLKDVPEEFKDKAEIVNGSLSDVLEQIYSKGFHTLYIDGGTTIQSFLKEDLIDELILTTIPILIGGGTPLFGNLPQAMEFQHVKSEVFLNAITQDTYRRKRG
jgi:dihydrofolate reductase